MLFALLDDLKEAFPEDVEHVEDVDEDIDDEEAGGKYCACCTKLSASRGSLDGSSNMLVLAEILESFRKASKNDI